MRNANLNNLFDIVITIQSAAKNEFTDRATLMSFRIGVFPPKEKGGGDATEDTSKPDGETPTPPPAPPKA